MWTFDQNRYQKEILVPAVEEFIKSGGTSLPDVFERYALPLEGSDSSEIEQAIKAVAAFWNKTKENSKFGNLLKVLLADHKETSRELSDQNARDALREIVKAERKKKQEARFLDLDAVIKLASSKGYLLPEEKDSLLAKFTPLGLSQSEILSRIRVPIEKRIIKAPAEGLDSATRKKIRSNLAVLKKPNLFVFLELTSKSSKQELETKYQDLTLLWSKKKDDHNKIAANVLLSTVKDKLLKQGLQAYEQALVWDVIDDPQFRTQVEFAVTDRRISREQFEVLVNGGLKHGLSRDQTIQAILWLAHEKGVVVEQSEQSASVACAACHASVARNNNTCTICGAELWTNCPKCKTKQAASDTACGKCGFVIADRYRVSLLISKVQFALEEKRLEDALKLAREAERIWGRADGVEQILNKVEELTRQADSHRKSYDEALKQRRLSSARGALASLANVSLQHKGWDGKTPEQLQRELEAQLQKVEDLLQTAYEYERQKNTNEAVRVYEQVLKIEADSAEAKQGLTRCPPEPPHNVKTKVYDGKILIEWSKSVAVGSLQYLIVRSEGRAPVNLSDGTLVTKVSSESFFDESVPAGSFVHYGVFTERGGVHSRAAVSEGVLAVKEVENFTLETGDALVRGRWDFSDPLGKVCVLCGGSDDSLRQGKGRLLQLINPHSFEDTGLKNDDTYTYRVFVEYRYPDGKTELTPGRFATATPATPPAPLESFDITAVAGELRFDWTPPPFGTVSIYKLLKEPEWKCGTQISMASLMQLGTPLRNTRAGHAVDPSLSTNLVYYTPFSVAGAAVVVGQAKTFITAAEISDLQVEDFESYLLLRWKWPPGVQSVLVCWRHDDYPDGARDPKSSRQKFTKGEYDANGGFRISNPQARPYKFVVYTVADLNGQPVYSNGFNRDCRAEIRKHAVFNIWYSLKTKGWIRKTIVVSLACDATELSLPELLVVAKSGRTQPLHSQEGIIMARINNARPQPQAPFQQEFKIPALKRPFFLRLFFASAESYQGFKLHDPPPSHLKVR